MSRIDTLEAFLEAYIDEPALTIAIERYEVPNEENFWQWRELYRIYKEDLKKPNFSLLEDLDKIHNVHIDPDDPRLLRYFPDEEKGKRDVPTSIKYGKYLTRFYSDHFNNEKIKELVSEHLYNVSPAELHFVAENDHDLAEEIYEIGPNSCMKRERGHIKSITHPCRAYPTESTTIAYIKKGDRITARCIVNPESKRYVRIYGDSGMMKPLLQEAGYQQSDYALDGCRLHRIKDHEDNQTSDRGYETLVIPYLDGSAVYGIPDPEDPDNYIKIIADTDGVSEYFGLQNACGYSNVQDLTHRACASCGCTFTAAEMHRVNNGMACNGCFDTEYVEALGSENDLIHTHREIAIRIFGSYYTDEDAAGAHGWRHTEQGWAAQALTTNDYITAYRIQYTVEGGLNDGQLLSNDTRALGPGTNLFHRLGIDPFKPAEERYKYYAYSAYNREDQVDKVATQFMPLIDESILRDRTQIAERLTEITGVHYDPLCDVLPATIEHLGATMPRDLLQFITPITRPEQAAA